jgi:hypothetical protein
LIFIYSPPSSSVIGAEGALRKQECKKLLQARRRIDPPGLQSGLGVIEIDITSHMADAVMACSAMEMRARGTAHREARRRSDRSEAMTTQAQALGEAEAFFGPRALDLLAETAESGTELHRGAIG